MSLGIIRKKLERRREEKELAAREIHPEYPKHLPPHLRINAVVDISNAAFILYGDHIHFEYPGKTHMVKRISTFKLFDLDVIRAYVANIETNEESIIQFNGSMKEDEFEIYDILVFVRADTIYPQTAMEWDEWMNDRDGILGYKTLQFNQEGGDIEFERDWESEGADWVRPLEIREIVFTDPYEAPAYYIRQAMLYAREIEDSEEYEYALAEVVKAREEDRIEMSFGIIVEIANVEIH